LEETMEKRKTYLKKVIKHWHINLVPTLSNYLNGKTRPRKQGTQGVLMNEMDTSIGGMDARYARMWTSNYFATFQNKGVKTYSNPTGFKNGILKNK